MDKDASLLNHSAVVIAFLVAGRIACGQTGPFRDGFEDNKGWFLFEEIVGESVCYAAGIGSMDRSSEFAFSGQHSLRLWANKSAANKSNHLIAVNRLANTGRRGKWTYSANVLIPDGPDGYQTGPEISIQNTRLQPPGSFLTHTAAVQYQANRFQHRPGTWAVWREKSPGVGGWESVFERMLLPGKWYRLSLEVDYDNNRYGWLTIHGEDGKRSVDLTSFVMAGEKKHKEEAFAITLEGENLWNNCGTAGVFQQRFFYDDVSLVQTENPHVISALPGPEVEGRQQFQFQFQAASEDRTLDVVNVLVNGSLSQRAGCYLAYSVQPNELYLMNENGDATLDKMMVNGRGKLSGRYCTVSGASTVFSGTTLLLTLDVTFSRKSFAGNHIIFLAARDTHGGNSGWVEAGKVLVLPVLSPTVP